MLREIDRWQAPEQLERQLLPLQEAAYAVGQDRVVDGVALHPAMCLAETSSIQQEDAWGFFLDEVLGAYGGRKGVESSCSGCPANALRHHGSAQWAGCFGWLVVSDDGPARDALIENAAEKSGIARRLTESLLPTTPRWQGFWAQSPLTETQVELLERLFSHVRRHGKLRCLRLDEFQAALTAARQHKLALHVTLTPSARVEGRAWLLPSHCARCKTKRPAGDPHCRVCGLSGNVAPARHRKARGMRPYEPLAKIMSRERAEQLVQEFHSRKSEAGGEAIRSVHFWQPRGNHHVHT